MRFTKMVPEKAEFQAVLLAGGRGSRMPELTSHIIKALLPVANQPLIFYPLQWLSASGVDEVIIICLDTQKNEIQQALAVGFSNHHRMRLTYAVIPADEVDFDTADSLRHIATRIKSDFLVVSCDFISNLPLGRMLDMFRTCDATMVACFIPNPTVSDTVNIPGPKSKRSFEKENLMYDEQSMRIVRSFGEVEVDDDGYQLTWKIFERFPCIRSRSTFRDAHVYVFKRWIIDYVNHPEMKRQILSLADDLKPKLLRRQFQAFGKLPTALTHWPPNKPAGGRSSSAPISAAGQMSAIHLPNIRSPLDRMRQHAFLTQQSVVASPANASLLKNVNGRSTDKLDVLTLIDYAPEELLMQSLSILNANESSGVSRLTREPDVVEAVKCYAYLVESNTSSISNDDGVFGYRVNNVQSYCEANRAHAKLRTVIAQNAANPLPAAQQSFNSVQRRERGTSSTSDSQSTSADYSSSVDSGAVVSGGDNMVFKQHVSIDAGKPQIGNDSTVGEKSTVGDKAVIKKSVIGKNCTIGEKVVSSNCIIMDSVVVEKGSTLQNCIICSDARIADRCELKDCIVGFGVEVKSGSKIANETLSAIVDDDDMS